MYCSSCASPVTPGLSYCNRCGAELNGKRQAKKTGSTKESELPESLVWAIVAVACGGLGLMIGLMAVMKNELHFSNGMIMIISLLSFLLLVSAESVFIWLLFKSTRRVKAQERGATKELFETQERFLSEPATSVTDQTTRTLDPVLRERGMR